MQRINIFVSLTLTAGVLLASCQESAEITETSGQKTVTTAVVDGETAKLSDNLSEADFNGEVFNIFGERQTTLSDYFFVEEMSGEIIDDSVFLRNKTVEDRYNIELEFTLVDWDDGAEIIKTYTLAGDNSFDLYTCTHLRLGQLIVERYFVDWQQVDSVDLSLPCYVEKANETYSIGDTMPLLYGDFMESNILRCWHFVFNKRLAEENNLEDPYTAVREGRWTLDYLMNQIKDVSRDLNGDTLWTVDDFYGFATDKLATLDAFSRSLGINAIGKDENNLPVLTYYNDNVPLAFEKLYQLYYTGNMTYVSEDSLAHINDVFALGNAVFASFRIDQLMNAEIREMTDDYGVLPYPKLDESTDGYGTYLSGTFSAQMICVNQPQENWHKIGTIVEALNVYSHELVLPAIYEVTLKTKTSRDENSIEMLDLILDSRTYSFDSCDEDGFPLSPIKTLRDLIGRKKSTDIASYYASVEATAQAWIDNMIEAYQG